MNLPDKKYVYTRITDEQNRQLRYYTLLVGKSVSQVLREWIAEKLSEVPVMELTQKGDHKNG